MIGAEYNIDELDEKYTGVKVSQFSFNRLATIIGQVQKCYQQVRLHVLGKLSEAYLKALVSTGFKVKNECNVLVSIGTNQDRNELYEYIQLLSRNGFNLYGTSGTAKYYSDMNINIMELYNNEIQHNIKEGFWLGNKYINTK